MTYTDEQRPKFRVNKPLRLDGKDDIYTVSAIFRLENFYLYELAGLPDFLVKERRLHSAALDTET